MAAARRRFGPAAAGLGSSMALSDKGFPRIDKTSFN
jgi:hypothetical protein